MPTPLTQRHRRVLGSWDAGPGRTVIVLVLDHAGRITRWNRAAEALTGLSETEMVGHPLWNKLVFDDDAEPIERELKRIMSGHFAGSLEYRWKMSDGTARWMVCSNFEPCVSPDGMKCLAFVATDVTESRRIGDWRTPLFGEFIRARDSERHEISRFIHDTVSQNLLALNFSLDHWRHDPGVHDAGQALDLIERCCRDVRLLGYMLSPPTLGDDAGLEEAIEYHVRTLKESGALDIEFRAELAPNVVSRAASGVLFAAVHEVSAKAITSRASRRLVIVLKRDGSSIVLEIGGSFDFRGTGPREFPTLRERVRAIGGRLQMTPDSMRVTLPVALAVAAA
jgi:PAS domain S-box-containing protein